tara:strand:- start:673 stop:789 length:117 start_codon:yes stop_codon:yes gene_type:complete
VKARSEERVICDERGLIFFFLFSKTSLIYNEELIYTRS